MKEIERRCLQALIGIVQNIYDQMKAGHVPEIHIATRTKHNIEFNEESEVWVYGDRKSVRSAKTVKGAYRILKMTYVIGFLKEQLSLNKSSTSESFTTSRRAGERRSSRSSLRVTDLLRILRF